MMKKGKEEQGKSKGKRGRDLSVEDITAHYEKKSKIKERRKKKMMNNKEKIGGRRKLT